MVLVDKAKQFLLYWYYCILTFCNLKFQMNLSPPPLFGDFHAAMWWLTIHQRVVLPSRCVGCHCDTKCDSDIVIQWLKLVVKYVSFPLLTISKSWGEEWGECCWAWIQLYITSNEQSSHWLKILFGSWTQNETETRDRKIGTLGTQWWQ